MMHPAYFGLLDDQKPHLDNRHGTIGHYCTGWQRDPSFRKLSGE
jgi:hypothetical protein